MIRLFFRAKRHGYHHHNDYRYPYRGPGPVVPVAPVYIPPPVFRPVIQPIYPDYNRHEHHDPYRHHGHHRGGW